MAEKLKLIELDIDIKKLIDSSSKTLKHLDFLKEKKKELAKSSKELRGRLDKLREAMKNPELDESSQKYQQLKTDLTETSKLYSEVTEDLTKNQVGLNSVSKEYRTNLKLLDAYSEKQRKQITVIKQTDGSIDQLQQALSKNRDAYRSLSKEERESTEVGQKLLKIIQEQDKEYKDLQTSIGTTQVHVGGYKEQMKEALAETNLFTRATAEVKGALSLVSAVFIPFKAVVKGAISDFKAMSNAEKSSARATLFLKGALKALSATPLLLTLTLIIASVSSVLVWFKKTQKGADKLGQILAGVNAVIDVAIDRFSKIGGILFGLVTGQKSLSEAWNEGKEAISGLVDEMKEELEISIKLEKKLQDIKKQEVLLDIQRSAQRKTLKALNKVAEDTSKPLKERMKALEESAEIETELMQRTLKLSEDRLANQLGEIELTEKGRATLERFRQGAISADEAIGSLGLSESTVEDLEKFRDVFKDVEDKQAELLEIQTTRQNKYNTLAREAQARAKKRVEEAIKEQKTQLNIFIASQDVKAKTLAEEVKLAEQVSKKKRDILKAELKANKITKSEYDLAILQEDNNLAKKRAELAVENANRELQIFKDTHQKKIDENAFYSEEIHKQELKRLENIKIAEEKYHEKRLEEGVINQQQYNDAIKLVNDEFQDKKDVAENQRKEAEKERKAIDLENQRLIDEENFLTDFEIKRARLEQQRLLEIEEAEKTFADVTLIERRYSLLRRKINEEEVQAKLSGYATLFGKIAGFISQETILGKAAAFAQASVNIAQGITKALASKGFMGIAEGVVIAGAGAVQLEKIASTKLPKAEKGMSFTIGGKRHSQGGTKFYGEDGTAFEAEKGEKLIVLNRIASQHLGILDALNQATGGNPLGYMGSYLEGGGTVKMTNRPMPKPQNFSIDYDLLAEKVAEANRELPNPVVSVETIIEETQMLTDIINSANH